MGTDIHIQVEVYRKLEGRWVWINNFLPPYINKTKYIPISINRDYHLFAILAGVRNSWGLTPISEPKGLPKDINLDLYEASKEDPDILGEHSFSYLTVTELKEYNWKDYVVRGDFNSYFQLTTLDFILESRFDYGEWDKEDNPSDFVRIVFGFDS